MTPHLPGRRTLAVVAAILGLVGCQRDAPLSNNTLRVGMSLERPGFAVRTPQGIAGFDVDVATHVARRLGRDSIDIIETPPAQLAMVLATGQVDLVVSGLPMTEDRAAEMITVAGPYLTGSQRLMTRLGSALTVQHLAGRRVCTVTGTTAQDLVVATMPGVHLITRNNHPDCIDALIDRTVDGVLADDIILTGYAGDPVYGPQVTLKRAVAATEAYGIGLPQGEQASCRQVDAALAEMIASGAWQRAAQTNLASLGYVVTPTLNPPPPQPCAALPSVSG